MEAPEGAAVIIASSQRASKPPEDMLPRKEEVEDTVIKAHATFSATVLMVVVLIVVVGGMMMEKLGPAMGWESGISGVERTASAWAGRGVCQLPGHTTGSLRGANRRYRALQQGFTNTEQSAEREGRSTQGRKPKTLHTAERPEHSLSRPNCK
ncbi:unnamed protein product [Boreogadus saida]